jgi:probable phosphoglycerate mutase
MTTLRVFLLRHGEIAVGPERRFVGRRDLPLTETGVRQARMWGEILRATHFASVYSSDLTRCVDTAKIIAERRGLPIERLLELREICLGEWEGLTVEEVRNRFPTEWRKRGANLAGYGPPGGESFLDVQARAVAAFERAVSRADGDLLIVAHSGVNRVILCHVLGLPAAHLMRFSQDYGCLNVIECRDDKRQVRVLNLQPELLGPAASDKLCERITDG